MQVKPDGVEITGLRFEYKHTRAALLCLRFGYFHKTFAQSLFTVVFVHPQFGHSYSVCPLFGIKFDSSDKLFAVESAVCVCGLPMFLKQFVGVVEFFLRMSYWIRKAGD